MVVVELDIFSGRPNPRWELTQESSQRFRGLLERLKVAAAEPPEPPGLGYRGFLIANGANRMRAYRGFVIRPERVLADPSLSVERFLLGELPLELQGLGRRVEAEITHR